MTDKTNYIKARRNNYIVIDIETTGLDSNEHEIIEICALKIKSCKEDGKFSTLIKPSNEVDDFICSLTNITNEMLTSAPKIEDVLIDLYDFIGTDTVLLGHNIKFDLEFLNNNLKKYYGKELTNKYMDTLHLSKNFIKNVDDYKLETLKRHLNINTKSHRAHDDCVSTYLIYEYIKNFTSEKNLTITGYIKDTSIKYNKAYNTINGQDNLSKKENNQVENLLKNNKDFKNNSDDWYANTTTKQRILLFLLSMGILIAAVIFALSL